MFGDWMLEETKIKIWQDAKDEMDELFQRAIEFCTYGG